MNNPNQDGFIAILDYNTTEEDGRKFYFEEIQTSGLQTFIN